MTGENIFQRKVILPATAEDAFAYHDRPGALQRLIPPWENVEVERSDNSLRVGSQVVLKTKLFGVPLRWVAEHTEYDPPSMFADKQVSGPFRTWLHQHSFQNLEPRLGVDPAGPSDSGHTIEDSHNGSVRSELTDSVRYRLPGGPLGQWLGNGLVESKLRRMFAYRHQTTQADLGLFARYPTESVNIAISGASGLVGSAFETLIRLAGHRSVRLVRGAARRDDELALWSDDFPATEEARVRAESLDAVVHLAGKSIGDARWNPRVKQEIMDSRVQKTRQLCERIASLKRRPKVLLCASAIGVYGDRGDELLAETATLGNDFLAEVGRAWEEACRPAVEAGIRVVHLRFGVILSLRGGALAQMMFPAKMGGGRLGPGNQWMSWISIDDCVGAMYHALMYSEFPHGADAASASRDAVQGVQGAISGPMNVVAPNPLTNREFTTMLSHAVGRRPLVPAPASLLRVALGEMADSLLLASTRVEPAVLLRTGYQFRHPTLAVALPHLLGTEGRLDQTG